MPKAFSPREREIIHNKLLEKGRELFAQYGLKKTNIEEITRAVGIAKGSFYAFYNSKEELFFEIMERAEAEMRISYDFNTIMQGASAKEILKQILKQIFTSVENNEITRLLFNPQEFEQLARKLPPERIQAHMQKDEEYQVNLIRKLQQAGIIIIRDPRIIGELFKALFFISINKSYIHKDLYEGVMDLIIDLVAEGLTKKGGKEDDRSQKA